MQVRIELKSFIQLPEILLIKLIEAYRLLFTEVKTKHFFLFLGSRRPVQPATRNHEGGRLPLPEAFLTPKDHILHH